MEVTELGGVGRGANVATHYRGTSSWTTDPVGPLTAQTMGPPGLRMVDALGNTTRRLTLDLRAGCIAVTGPGSGYT